MGTVHQLLLDLGREEALKGEFDRRAVEAAASYLATEESEIGLVPSRMWWEIGAA